ncbi:methyltransferase domain-containing protein [Pseudomonas aeruginosa]|uniref:Methyltransferase domain-containing protein n=12 Tax=Bacteria TaxID=2 RepID=A0A367MA74_PSEAI|nr:methyltransferase domain-containing protein [Pseudomonas aeruginosa]
MKGPLSSLKVLDFSTLLPGPFASLLLADMGADVLRVESPGRMDLVRVLPPHVDGTSASHAYLNRNKRSIGLDLKRQGAREVVLELVREYDIVLEQFRPGVMDKLGVGYEALKAANPRLIYVAITGYGQTGPYRERAGHDINYLALAGVASYTGRRERGPLPLVVQLASAAMELRKDEVLAALLQVLKPAAVLWKNDSSARDAEGLERYVANAYGEVPEWVALEENGVKFEAPVLAGQKTGWFYDHRMNRARLAPYVRGKRVLDLFSYIGGWGIQAAAFGASEVMCVDASAFALDGVERNAALNGVAEKVACVEGDVFEALRELKAADERFDVVIADPPAFIKRKKDLKNGEAAYRRLNEQAMRLLSKDGILVSASCSMHLPEDDLQNILIGSARHLDRNIQLLERGGQGPDHPVHLAIAETRYIKSLTCRLLPNG